MTLNELKAELGISALPLKACKDKEGKITNWLRYWNNDNRFQVVIPREDIKLCLAHPNTDLVVLRSTETGEESKKEYKNYICFTDKDVEIVA